MSACAGMTGTILIIDALNRQMKHGNLPAIDKRFIHGHRGVDFATFQRCNMCAAVQTESPPAISLFIPLGNSTGVTRDSP
jgi:hypothetical protein